MAKGIKELRLRIRSIKNTKKITRAMEMVSAAKLRRAQMAMEAAKPFSRKLELLLARLSRSETAQKHPLFQSRSHMDLPPLYVLFTSDRGLAGAFNANLIKAAERELRKHPNALLYCVGRKGRDYFKKRIGARLVGETIPGGVLDGEITDAIANRLLEVWESGAVREINIIASEFVSTANNRPQVSRYLPLEASAFELGEDAESERAMDYILEPSPERIFEALLPRYLRSKIFLTLAESYTSEHASRMLAMNNATKNCDDLSGSLTLEMNKARQSAITTEIIEIVSGAEALNA